MRPKPVGKPLQISRRLRNVCVKDCSVQVTLPVGSAFHAEQPSRSNNKNIKYLHMNSLELQYENWLGSLPIMITLSQDDLTTIESPPEFFVKILQFVFSFFFFLNELLQIMGRRNGYLPFLSVAVTAHFEHFIPPVKENLWFDYKDLPLKWYFLRPFFLPLWNKALREFFRNIPLGVLYDILANGELPWKITVRKPFTIASLSPLELIKCPLGTL